MAPDDPNPFVRREPSDPPSEPAGTHGGFPRETVYILTRDAAQELDRLAVEQFGIPSIVLMENAALALATETIDLMMTAGVRTALVVCGPGNNGGDGLALARHLHNAGATVKIALAARAGSYRGDAAINLEIVERMGLPMLDASAGEIDAGRLAEFPAVIIDALFGTGLTRPIDGPAAGLIAWINAARERGSRVVSVDLPSGLDADSGAVLGVAVAADLTVTLAGIKPGLIRLEAQQHVGELSVGDIGCPHELIEHLGEPLGPPRGSEA
ncbi:MAG: hypothetical protein DHS20C14_19340 [Phycisphaeraceae bacterium]|nr:MAG: hypothetical protein DHS20C14_19340 [Phycisphaeraceae bacterium]